MSTFTVEALKNQFINRNRKFQKIILVSHDFSLVFWKDGQQKRIRPDELMQECRSKQKTLVLLASPFAFSYLQTTIPLTPKEQLQANEQKLGFSRFPSELHQVHSLQLDGDKWITIYTHLSDEGKALLDELHQQKIKISWKPALMFFIKNFLSGAPPLIKEGNSALLVIGREALKCSRTQTTFHFQHLFAWDSNRSMSEHLAMMEHLWEIKPEHSHSTTFNLDTSLLETDPPLEFFHNLLFPPNTLPLSMTFSQKTRPLPAIASFVSPLRLAILSFLGILIWSGLSYSDLQNLKERRAKLKQEIHSLKAVSNQFQPLAASERSLVKMKVLKSTVREMQLKPAELLVKIEALLGGKTWIKSISISTRVVRLELLDQNDDNTSELIERLSKSLGPVNLEESSTELFKEKTLKKYVLTIKRRKAHAPADQLAQR